MLNTFPHLLVLGFYAPTIIRVAAALAFLYVAYAQWQHRNEIARMHFPIVGHGTWIAWVFVAFHTAVGAMLLFGYYTQIAAILAVVGLLKGLWLNRRHPHLVILSNAAVLLLVGMCLSLLISGAGALAQDLPL